jgi:predicted MFS family arabinose efflux permease
MSLNSAVQSSAMGLAAFAGGAMVQRDEAGLLQGYGSTGWMALVLTLAAVVWVSRLKLITTQA